MTTEAEVWASTTYNYIARDSDGDWYSYGACPERGNYLWFSGGGQTQIHPDLPPSWNDDNWEDSLHTRPGIVESVKDTPTESPSSTSLAVGDYLEKAEAFNAASSAFTKSCKDLREVLDRNQRFVTRVDSAYYLVTTDQDGNFDVDPIESL